MTDKLTETREELDAAFKSFHRQRDLSVARFQTCADVERIYHKAAAHLARELVPMPYAERLDCQPQKWVVNVLFDRLRIDTFHLLRCVGGHCIDEAEASGIGKIPPTLQEIEQQAAALRQLKSVSNKFTRHEDADGLRVIEMEEVRWSLR